MVIPSRSLNSQKHMSMTQHELHRGLESQVEQTRHRIAELVRPVDLARLNEHPEPQGWSVAQVLEHLCVTDGAYESPLAVLLRGARADAGAPAREWRPSFLGKRIAGALENPRPLKAPRAFRPGPTPRNGVVEAFLMRESAFVRTMAEAASFDWRALRISSPALPSWLPKLNLGDAFKIHAVHVSRHAKQIERLVKRV